MKRPDQFTCLLRNLDAGQEATVRTRDATMDWLEIGKGVYVKAIYCHPAYPTYIQSLACEMPGWMNPAVIKISGTNINNLTYADGTESVNSLCRETRNPQVAQGNKLQVIDIFPFSVDDTWFCINLTFLKLWANECIFLMEMLFLRYVNEAIYLLWNLSFFKFVPVLLKTNFFFSFSQTLGW